MFARSSISFGDFHLDRDAEQLRHRGVARPLRPKSFAVLWYLANHAGRLVPQDELMRAVWPGTSVGSAVLRVSIREIRAALGESAHLLITVPRQGHRFALAAGKDAETSPFVGREHELAALHRALMRARSGARQMVFVSGDAGVGKSRLVRRFLDEVRRAGGARVASGQCVELYDGLEPYAPVIDLLACLCRQPGGDEVEAATRRLAPAWLRQLPGHGDSGDAPIPRPTAGGSGHLLRELSTLGEALASEQPLILHLEDLHWTDASTVDALSHVAQRDLPAALLIICTVRPQVGVHADRVEQLMRQLLARSRCTKMSLGPLSESEVGSYLTQRLAPHRLGPGMAATLHARTGGHPLFLDAMVDHLVDRGQLVVRDGWWRIAGTLDGVIPSAIREMIAWTFETVTPEQRRVLEAACVAGTAFSAATLAAMLGLSVDAVEDICDQLVEERRLVSGGTEQGPNGTASARYAFQHAMYADVLYASLTPALRSRHHRTIGDCVSAAHSGHMRDVASLLAHHFTLAGDEERAWFAHRQAARAARDSLAAREAMGHLEAAVTLLRALPADDKRASVELRCLLELGECTISVHGYGAPAVARVYERACEVATMTDDVASHVLAESGLFMHHALRAEFATAQKKAEDILRFATREPLFKGTGLGSLGTVLLSRGEVRSAFDAFWKAEEAWQPWPEVAPDLRALSCGFRAICALVLGHPGEAHGELSQMLQRVAGLPFDPLLVAQAHALAAYFHAAAGNPEEARRAADVAIAVTESHGVPLYLSPKVVQGWATRDPAAIRGEMARMADSHNLLGTPQYGALLAEALLDCGELTAAAEAIDHALATAEKTGEKYYLAELHRLRGRCLLHAARPTLSRDAVLAMEQAMSIAESQGSRLLLLRAAIDACSVATRSQTARDRLRTILGEMDDGSDTVDLVRARTLLADA